MTEVYLILGHPKLSICSLKQIVKTRLADFTTTAHNNLKQDTPGENKLSVKKIT